jgi:hypothetical protein
MLPQAASTCSARFQSFLADASYRADPNGETDALQTNKQTNKQTKSIALADV